MMRGIGIIGVVVHHALLYLPRQDSITLRTIQTLAGSTVHLFFILSGCGLTISFFKQNQFSWGKWVKKRFLRIIVPYWIIIILTFSIVTLANIIFPDVIIRSYSWKSLLSYLTFTRNFYEPSWGLNPPMWFMPIIIGLYILFPFLMRVLKRYGILALIIISVVLTYGSITLFLALDFPTKHQAAPFLFFVAEFSFGMLIGYVVCFHSALIKRLEKFNMLCLGVGAYLFSWVLRTFWSLGPLYNDIFTAVGIYLMVLYACSWLIRISPKKSVHFLSRVSEESYVMYLIHGPLLLFVLKPVLVSGMNTILGPFVAVLLCGCFCVAIFMLARCISRPIGSFTSRLTAVSLKSG